MPAGTPFLKPGERLNSGDYLISQNGKYRLAFVPNGMKWNLCLYVTDEFEDDGSYKRLFFIERDAEPQTESYCIMEDDGNFGMYCLVHDPFLDQKLLWETDTHGFRNPDTGFPDVFLQVTDDGNIFMVSTYYAIWRRGKLGKYRVDQPIQFPFYELD